MRSRIQNAEVLYNLIVQMISKFISYDDFFHQMLIDEEDIRCVRDQKRAEFFKKLHMKKLTDGQIVRMKSIVN